MTRLLTTLCAVTAAGVLAAGCGSSGSSGGTSSSTGTSSAGGGAYGGGAPAKTTTSTSSSTAATAGARTALTLAAQESNGLSFDKKTLAAKAGTVTITMDNPSADSLPHAIAVEGPGGVSKSGATAQPGSTSKVSLALKPGKYTFFCPVPGHRAAGMEGTLTVR